MSVLALVLFGLASCGPESPENPENTENEPEVVTDEEPEHAQFTITLFDITWEKVTYSITPSNDEAEYVYSIFTKERVNDFESTKACMERQVAMSYGYYTYEQMKSQDMLHSGKTDQETFPDYLNELTEYVLVVAQLDHNKKIVGDVFEKSFTTLPENYVDLGLPSGTLWKNANEHNAESDLWGYSDLYKSNLPDTTQWRELRKKCAWTYQSSTKGYAVKGPNGNSIFLPLAGSRLSSGGQIYNNGTKGAYWTRTSGYDKNSMWDAQFAEDDSRVLFGYVLKNSQLSMRFVAANPNKK